MKLKIDKTLVASVALHVLVIGWGLVSFATKAFESIPEESVTVDVVSANTLSKAGMKNGNKAEPKPLVEKVAEARPVDDVVGKISEKAPIVTDTAPPPQPQVEDKPVEKKPDPPKPVAESKPKEEPKQVEKKPDPPKIDPIAEALKKEQKKPKPQAQTAAKPPEPAKPKPDRVFDPLKIATALQDKRDPTHQAVTGEALNSNAALGLAKGHAADNSATWGAMFKEQVARCWRKPDTGIDTQRIEAQFDIKLRKDGTLEAMPVAMTSPSSQFQRVFLESGMRAIVECAPYRLPPVFFEEWKWFTPIFDSSEDR